MRTELLSYLSSSASLWRSPAEFGPELKPGPICNYSLWISIGPGPIYTLKLLISGPSCLTFEKFLFVSISLVESIPALEKEVFTGFSEDWKYRNFSSRRRKGLRVTPQPKKKKSCVMCNNPVIDSCDYGGWVWVGGTTFQKEIPLWVDILRIGTDTLMRWAVFESIFVFTSLPCYSFNKYLPSTHWWEVDTVSAARSIASDDCLGSGGHLCSSLYMGFRSDRSGSSAFSPVCYLGYSIDWLSNNSLGLYASSKLDNNYHMEL